MRVVVTNGSYVPQLCRVLNAIIQAGGTTALEDEYSNQLFEQEFVNGKDVLSSLTLLSGIGDARGFQILSSAYCEDGEWADIGTYVDPNLGIRGGGTLLFADTAANARKHGLKYLRAVIRADNAAGLAYYSKMGFVDFDVFKDQPLKDGTLVDRICKKFVLA